MRHIKQKPYKRHKKLTRYKTSYKSQKGNYRKDIKTKEPQKRYKTIATEYIIEEDRDRDRSDKKRIKVIEEDFMQKP